MVAVPIKPEYGPTLGRLLAPRWQAASRLVHGVVIAAGALLLVAVVAITLTLLNATFSHAGRVPFSFEYRGLYRAAPDPGGYVKVQKRSAAGTLQYSFAVAPLTLPPYTGDLSGELPLYATSYIEMLRSRYSGFVLRGEGKTRVNTVPAYDVLYTALVQGRRMYGRDILLLPERSGAREGVAIAMLTARGASRQVEGPLEVGTTGVLLKPVRSFTIG